MRTSTGNFTGSWMQNAKTDMFRTAARGAIEGPALNPRRQCDVEGERGYNDTNESFNEGHVKESNDYTKVVNDALNKFPFCNFSTTLFGSGPNEVITYDTCIHTVLLRHIFSRVLATLHPALSVGRLVGRLVGWSPFYFFLSILFLLVIFGHIRVISHFKSF